MCICMTEEQKKVINETGNMMVIDFKRILNKIKLSFEEFLDTVRICVGCLDKFHENFWKLQAKEKYTIVRRLNRCGFNQKEGLIPRSLLRNKLFQDMEEVIY